MKRGIRDWGLEQVGWAERSEPHRGACGQNGGARCARPTLRKKSADRAGYALVLFVMMFFGLMGLAALVIDMGFARLAQRQMQTAVDSAALEGLRWRDDASGGGDVDANRRQKASNMAAYTFDADLDLSTSDTQYGAGPVVTFSGDSEVGALQSMQPGAPYKPSLQMNYPDNKPEGDMAAGTYHSGQPSAERDDYTRDDFTYAPPGSAPSVSNAFLVRLRRTANTNSNTSNNTSSLDQNDGISSSGPTLPVLFGRGSMMARSGNGLSVLSGITVRATAIAAAGDAVQSDGTLYSAGRAKAAGPPVQYTDPTSGDKVSLSGVAPFAVKADQWPPSATDQLLIAPTDQYGRVPTGAAQLIAATSVVMIGQRVGGPSVPPGNGNGPLSGSLAYVPIYNDIQDGVGNTYYGIVVGFGAVQKWNIDLIDGNYLTCTPLPPGQIGSCNVTGVLPPGLTMDTPAVSALFQYHSSFQNPLYAPVLVNHYIGPNP